MDDHRTTIRIDYTSEFECRHFYTPNGTHMDFEVPQHFKICDLSPGGIRIEGEVLLELDSILEYTLYLDDIPYTVMSRVKWLKPLENGHQYGMEFLTPSNMMYRQIKELVASKTSSP